MPTFVKLDASEVTALKARRYDEKALAPYVAGLTGMTAGDWGSVALEPGDHKRTVKRRTSIAASTWGFRVRWRRDDPEGRLVFRLEAK